MKTTAFLLPLLMLDAASLARPAEQDTLVAAESVQVRDPRDTHAPQDVQPEVERALVRERRSPQKKERGSVTGGVHREKGVGTVVQAQGQGNVWTSKGGNARVDAHGEWSKVVNGPGRAKPNYNVGIKFTGRF